MERVKRLLPNKLEFAPDSHKNAIDQLTDENLKTILRYVYDRNRDWWNWKDNHTVEDEVDTVFSDIGENKKDKGTQTTIASIGQALLNKNSPDKHDTLKNIHELWELITLNYEPLDKIKERRLDQFKDFKDLSPEEQQKDQVWIDAVKSIQLGGAKRKSHKSRKSKKSKKSRKSRKTRKSKKSRKSRKTRKSKGKK
jgi:hypothetical protein